MALLSIPSTSYQHRISLRPCSSAGLSSSTSLIRVPSKPLSASSSSPPTSVAQDDASPLSDSVPVQSERPPGDLAFRGCKACGKEELERGCNGEGRIQGGIAVVPGFGWWPIKAYRPCPAFIASGGRYRRSGQSMDEVAFGRTERVSAGLGATDELQSGKEKQGPRKFKR